MNVLVTGGAGYIGSHTCKALAAEGFTPVTVDSLITGHRRLIKWGPFYEGDIRDSSMLEKIFASHDIKAVMHFAAHIDVGESVQDPMKYYDNNVVGSIQLLNQMIRHNIYNFIFSSSCTVYGNSSKEELTENDPLTPINPYGETKMAIENLIHDLKKNHPLKTVIFRYFNAGGADRDGELGETHDQETHIIPLAIRAALDPDYTLEVFGKDYATPDGSCIRDYVHVDDVAQAHVKALKRILTKDCIASVNIFNLGSGRGYSVFEILNHVEKIVGKPVKYKIGTRREGDPARLIADTKKSRQLLDWTPQFSDLSTIIRTACEWYLKSR